MIGSALKKMAAENGMKISNGVAYGSLGGFAATLSEGSGYKRIAFSTVVADPVKLTVLRQQFEGRNLMKQYRVQKLEFASKFINIVFHDNPGTMKKLRAFLDEFLPALAESGATGWDICVECGMPITQGSWKLIEGTAFYMHEQCAQRIKYQAEAEKEAQRLENRGSYITGTIGALLGTALGAVLWALVLYQGYVASLIGLLIAFLAVKGYDLFKGRQGKGKIVILILCVALGVLLGTFGAYTYELVELINSSLLYGISYSDIPMMFIAMFGEPEFLAAAGKDILMGLLYAVLGASVIVYQTGKEVADFKMIDLK